MKRSMAQREYGDPHQLRRLAADSELEANAVRQLFCCATTLANTISSSYELQFCIHPGILVFDWRNQRYRIYLIHHCSSMNASAA